MSKNNSASPLVGNNNASYAVVNGVKYFKLKSEFEGDYTKNCGLLGNEIDENFYFLRGYDIESVYLTDDGVLTIERVDKDYDPIEINLADSTRLSFNLNKETGELEITYPDGEVEAIGGFLFEGGENVRVASDSTLIGNGTTNKPLGISPMEKTGTFAPADDFIDLTNIGQDAWGTPISKAIDYEVPGGYRIVSKEKVTKFGFLYPYSGVEAIQEELETAGSKWRVPTKEDWDELLNSMEEEEYRNHDVNTVGEHGQFAGSILKSIDLWDATANEDAKGVDAVGFGAFPVGGVNKRSTWMKPESQEDQDLYDSDIEGLGKFTGFWSNTQDADSAVFAKVFTYYEGGVENIKTQKESLYSIRLVKDYDLAEGLDSDNEDILGYNYPIAKIPGRCTDYAKVWTLINFYNDPDAFGGKASFEWSGVTDGEAGIRTIYYINEWDGGRKRWFKKELKEGESIVLLNNQGVKDYHEYRLINGELVDTLAPIEDYVSGATEEFVERLQGMEDAVSANTQAIADETARAQEAEGNIMNLISEITSGTSEERDRAMEVEAALSAAVITETERALLAESGLSQDIAREESRAEGAEAELDSKLSYLSGRVDSLRDELKDDIDGETNRALAAESAISQTVENYKGLLDAKDNEIEAKADKVFELSGSVETIYADIIKVGEYELGSEGASLETNGGGEVKLNVSDDFFNFGSILN